jgi:biopolymer transport protein ExbD
MAIKVPQRRLAPRFLLSKLLGGKLAKGRKSGNAELQLTSMVDMFTLLVIFLLANFSASGEMLPGKDIQLPTAIHGTALERVPVVAITDSFVALEGQRIVSADETARDEILEIRQLEDHLRDMKKLEELVHRGDADHAFAGKINIQADKKTHFKLIKRVMYSCAVAGYDQINLAALVGKQEE